MYTGSPRDDLALGLQTLPWVGVVTLWHLSILDISDNISETVQDKDIFTMED